MKSSNVSPVLEYQFEDHKLQLRTIIVGNFLMFMVIFLSDVQNISNNPFAFFCLISGLLILIVNRFYDWRNFTINLLLTITYSLIFLYELVLFGIPDPIIEYERSLSKGILLRLFLYAVPYIYTLLRIFLVIPLIRICRTSYKLKKTTYNKV